jgi:hypothetical protein
MNLFFVGVEQCGQPIAGDGVDRHQDGKLSVHTHIDVQRWLFFGGHYLYMESHRVTSAVLPRVCNRTSPQLLVSTLLR